MRFGKRDAAPVGSPKPPSGGTSNPNHSEHDGKSWGNATTAGGSSGNGWHSTNTTNGNDSAGSADRNNWTYENNDSAKSWGNVGGEAWNGGGDWQNGGWHGPRERNEW